MRFTEKHLIQHHIKKKTLFGVLSTILLIHKLHIVHLVFGQLGALQRAGNTTLTYYHHITLKGVTHPADREMLAFV